MWDLPENISRGTTQPAAQDGEASSGESRRRRESGIAMNRWCPRHRVACTTMHQATRCEGEKVRNCEEVGSWTPFLCEYVLSFAVRSDQGAQTFTDRCVVL